MRRNFSPSQGGCAYFAYKRFQQGVDVAFASTYESDPTANQYSSYPIGNETDQYNEPPFSNAGQQQQRGTWPNSIKIVSIQKNLFVCITLTGGNEYQAPTY